MKLRGGWSHSKQKPVFLLLALGRGSKGQRNFDVISSKFAAVSHLRNGEVTQHLRLRRRRKIKEGSSKKRCLSQKFKLLFTSSSFRALNTKLLVKAVLKVIKEYETNGLDAATSFPNGGGTKLGLAYLAHD